MPVKLTTVSNSLSAGSIIPERYQVEALIGQGGMGAVYRVADLRLPGRKCALKVLVTQPPGPALEGEFGDGCRQFLVEASTTSRVSLWRPSPLSRKTRTTSALASRSVLRMAKMTHLAC